MIALVAAYAAAVAWQHHVTGNNERKANAEAEAVARKFARDALMAAKQGPVTSESLRALTEAPGLSMIRVVLAGAGLQASSGE